MMEKSLEAPELDAETQTELSEVQDEIAKLRPQMELVTEQTRKATEEVRKSLCSQQKQMKERAEELRQELGPEVQKSSRRAGRNCSKRWRNFVIRCRETGWISSNWWFAGVTSKMIC